MSYSIEWHQKVRKFLRKLPKDIAARIVLKIREIKEESFHYLDHIVDKDYYKLRVGDYRVLIDIDFERKIIFVRVIDHRKNIYKNL